MSDLFISYASEDRPQAKLLAEALARQGWSVWWDRTMPTGSRYHQVIEEALRTARCVVVMWTAKSVTSDWVRAEAGEGLNRNVLVPVSLDDAVPPLVFRQIQTADLRGWEGDASAPPFRTLVADIAALVGSAPGAGGSKRKQGEAPTTARGREPVSAQEQRKGDRRARWPWIALAAVVVFGLGTWAAARLGWLEGFKPKPVPEPEIALLEVVPPRIPVGERAMLRWRTANAAAVEVRGLGSVAMAGERSVAPSATTVYTLVARNAEGRAVEREVELVVEAAPPPPQPDPPQILRFEPVPSRTVEGQGAELRWATSGADKIRIGDHGGLPPSGALKVSPRQTTTYTLVATNSEGRSVEREVKLVVQAAPPSPQRYPPQILRFEPVPSRVVEGQGAELWWETNGADKVRIGDHDGLPSSGMLKVSPRQTTSYTLFATNREGSTEREAVVEVAAAAPPPEIVSFTADRQTVRAGGRVELVWQTTNAERVELNGQRVRPSASDSYQLKETTIFTLTALNAAGGRASRRLRVVVEEPRREEVGLRARGKLRIAESSGADLDGGVAGGDRGEWDLSFDAKTPTDRFLYAYNGALIAPVKAGTLKLGRTACMAAPLTRLSMNIRRIERGSEFCVRTSRGRIAGWAAIGPVGPSPGVLEISYVTWENP